MALIRKLLFVSVFFMAGLVPASLVYADKTVDDKGFIRLKNGEEAWTDFPGVPGLKLMIIEGDPKKSGPYVVRYRFPSGVMSRPHFHPEDRFITVIQGTWWTGTGDTFDPKSTVALPAGSFMKHPAGAVHFDGSKDGEVTVQVVGFGPSGSTFLQPERGTTARSDDQ